MKLSITRAWDETSAFVKQEAGPLFLIAFGLAVLPGIILQVVAGRLVGPGLQFVPGTKPDIGPFLAVLPIIVLLFIPVFVLSIWGNLTINVLALRRETVIGSAFRNAARRILPLVGATLLLVLAAVVIMVPLFAVVGAGIRSGAPHLGVVALLFLILWLALVFIGIRLMLLTPVAAAEPLGPIAIVQRSWQLTAGHFWKLLGFLILVMIVFVVLVLVVGAIGGILITLIAGRPDPGSLSALLLQLLTGVLQGALVMYFAVLIARIYAQLSGDAAGMAEVFQ